MKLHETKGSIVTSCPGCNSRNSTFEWKIDGKEFGAIEHETQDNIWSSCIKSYRLFRCAGCERGALGIVIFGGTQRYPGNYSRLVNFYPAPYEHLSLPQKIPKGIIAEFREAEKCLGNGCYRAASALFRSVLDKILLDNGYKKPNVSLKSQIDEAAKDGVITQARKNLAHSQIRVLGNDILHDEWREITREDAEAAKHYCQRVLEDFYDDRESVLAMLYQLQRIRPKQ